MKKNNSILITIIVLLLLVIAFLVAYIYNNKNDVVDIKNKNMVDYNEYYIPKVDEDGNVEEVKIDLTNAQALEEDNLTSKDKKLIIYYDRNNEEFCYSNSNDMCGNKSIVIETETEEAYRLDYYSNKYVLYKDNNKIKIYNNDEAKSYIVDLRSDYFDYRLAVDEMTKKVIGIIYTESESGNDSYYSFDTGKVLYDKKYSSLSVVSEKYLFGRISKCTENNGCETLKVELLNPKNEEIYLSEDNIGIDNYYPELEFRIFANSKGSFVYLSKFEAEEEILKIYNKNLDVILTFDGLFDTDIDISSNGTLYIIDNSVVKEYDSNGKVINTSKTYDKVYQVISDYFVVISNDKLYLTTMDEKNIEICDWKKNYFYHSALSGWYRENGKYGIYLIVQNDITTKEEVYDYFKDKESEDFESIEDLEDYDLGYEYYYIPSTNEVGRIPTYIGGYAKPVLYLYPQKETKVTITFDHPERLTTTYPKYNNSWVVYAKPNGDLRDLNDKYYYALYWEENLNHKVDFSEGFYVTKDNAIEFLESKLSYIGLNNKERNEFIMYWLPILEKNKKNLVYFELTSERNKYSNINISPKPDSMLRIAIHIKKVNSIINIKEEKLTKFNRTGFSVVEWGGVLY